jgi:hypothetical protein
MHLVHHVCDITLSHNSTFYSTDSIAIAVMSDNYNDMI